MIVIMLLLLGKKGLCLAYLAVAKERVPLQPSQQLQIPVKQK